MPSAGLLDCGNKFPVQTGYSACFALRTATEASGIGLAFSSPMVTPLASEFTVVVICDISNGILDFLARKWRFSCEKMETDG